MNQETDIIATIVFDDFESAKEITLSSEMYGIPHLYTSLLANIEVRFEHIKFKDANYDQVLNICKIEYLSKILEQKNLEVLEIVRYKEQN